MDLDTVAAELYGLPPEDFTAARNARAAEARRGGDVELAGAIKSLRRPTITAWLANLLVRERQSDLNELLGLGDQMRRAQAALAGNELRQLSQQRHQLVAALREGATQLAGDLGKPVSDAIAQELRMTLEAALVDPDAAEALRSGRLTAAMQYTGFGSVELAGAPATSPSKGPTRPEKRDRHGKKGRSGGSERNHRIEATERTLQEALAAVREAEGTVDERDRHRQELRREQARRHELVTDMEDRLRALRESDNHAGVDLLIAEKEWAAAERRLRAAHQRATKAQAALDELRA
ncbi:MAG: hypothetical protein IVW52_14375 [Acidimicrobiales bacterium]|nr:hypothetical protein [Acidimicrobiales bacterium]